jgi:hypothetical protein
MWNLWAKALGEKSSVCDRQADRIALIRTVLISINIITNIIIVLGVIRHW